MCKGGVYNVQIWGTRSKYFERMKWSSDSRIDEVVFSWVCYYFYVRLGPRELETPKDFAYAL